MCWLVLIEIERGLNLGIEEDVVLFKYWIYFHHRVKHYLVVMSGPGLLRSGTLELEDESVTMFAECNLFAIVQSWRHRVLWNINVVW